MVPNSPAQSWQRILFGLLERPEIGTPLKEAALAGALRDWTRCLTAAVVAACEAAGWRASAKGFRGRVLPVARNEYLSLDVVAFSGSSARWPLPVAVFELENRPARSGRLFALEGRLRPGGGAVRLCLSTRCRGGDRPG